MSDKIKEEYTALKMQIMTAHGVRVLLQEDAGVKRAFAADEIKKAIKWMLVFADTENIELPNWIYDEYSEGAIK